MDDAAEPTANRRGVFPGSFNPLTIAHLEVARLARELHELDEVHLAISQVALDKPTPPGPPLEERIELIAADAASHDWLFVETTSAQLIVDIAMGYDVVIMGADKWEQVNDVRYYGTEAERDAALERLPQVVVATRDGAVAPRDAMETPDGIRSVSSTAARDGDRDMMAPQARTHWS